MSVSSEELLQTILLQVQKPVALFVAVAVLSVVITGFYLLYSRGKHGNTVLILGPSGSGKTTLFHKLRDGDKFNGFVTSMETNDDSFALHSEEGMPTRPVHIVDLPGHPRLRRKLELHVSPSLRGIVFLVDSADFIPRIRDTAEYLYEVLSNPTVVRARVPLLLGCNKCDLGAKAHTVEFIKKKLEKEIESLRSTRGALQGSAENQLPLANAAEPFTFANCRNKISVAAVSALLDGAGPAESFIRSVVPAK